MFFGAVQDEGKSLPEQAHHKPETRPFQPSAANFESFPHTETLICFVAMLLFNPLGSVTVTLTVRGSVEGVGDVLRNVILLRTA
ncbi:MAG: hypothetical protein FJ267_15920 [Planctomycetes bacterium]|nr:hypothetical protein [Planctomycetota bacterium]